MPPTAFLFRKRRPQSAKWNEWDYLLIEAVQTLESERCHCGLPVYICHSDDPHVRFRVEEDICEATKVTDAYEERQQKAGGDSYKRPHGSTLRPVPYTTDGSDLTRYRDAFYQADYEKRLEVLDSLRVS